MAATFTPSWTVTQELHASSSVANAGTATDSLNLATLGYYEVDAQIQITPATTPSGDVLIEAFGSVDAGTSADTVPLTQRRLTFTTTAVQRISIPGLRGPYVSIRITNSTGVSVTYVGRYAGLQQVSA
ncbi:MAG: hypothetical protein V2A73_12230 [Pseudomonadota bacterium]